MVEIREPNGGEPSEFQPTSPPPPPPEATPSIDFEPFEVDLSQQRRPEVKDNTLSKMASYTRLVMYAFFILYTVSRNLLWILYLRNSLSRFFVDLLHSNLDHWSHQSDPQRAYYFHCSLFGIRTTHLPILFGLYLIAVAYLRNGWLLCIHQTKLQSFCRRKFWFFFLSFDSKN